MYIGQMDGYGFAKVCVGLLAAFVVFCALCFLVFRILKRMFKTEVNVEEAKVTEKPDEMDIAGNRVALKLLGDE